MLAVKAWQRLLDRVNIVLKYSLPLAKVNHQDFFKICRYLVGYEGGHYANNIRIGQSQIPAFGNYVVFIHGVARLCASTMAWIALLG